MTDLLLPVTLHCHYARLSERITNSAVQGRLCSSDINLFKSVRSFVDLVASLAG